MAWQVRFVLDEEEQKRILDSCHKHPIYLQTHGQQENPCMHHREIYNSVHVSEHELKSGSDEEFRVDTVPIKKAKMSAGGRKINKTH